MDEKVYHIAEIDSLDKVEEYVEKYILEKDVELSVEKSGVKKSGVEKYGTQKSGAKKSGEKKSENEIIKSETIGIIPINLSKIKFFLYPIQKEYNSIKKSIILKSNKNFKLGNKLLESLENIGYNNIESNLCFVLFYSKKEDFYYFFEEMIEKIIEKIESYEKLLQG